MADATRRQVLQRVAQRDVTIGELAEAFAMTITGMRKHVRLLEEARLVRTEKVGRTRVCTVGPRKLDDVAAWITKYREDVEARFDHLAAYLERTRDDP